VAAVSAQQLHYECESGELVVLDVPFHHTGRDIGLTMRAEGTPSPAARASIDAIRLAVAELTPPGVIRHYSDERVSQVFDLDPQKVR